MAAGACTCGRRHDDLDRMAGEMADAIIENEVVSSVTLALTDAVIGHMTKRKPRRPDFAAYYRFLKPHEARFKRVMRSYWDDQRRTIVSNMKRTPASAVERMAGAGRSKGLTFSQLVEQWMFAKGLANKGLQVVYKDPALRLMVASALRQSKLYNISTNWDLFNPNVEKWLKGYAPRFSEKLNEVSVDDLKRELRDGWEKGESIPDLIKRVNTTYDDWNRTRSEAIARSESIRASNQAALMTYEASGVVDRVMWVATPDERECPICEGLDGKTVKLNGAFPFTETYDAGDGNSPPAHPNCRCTLVPVLEGEDL